MAVDKKQRLVPGAMYIPPTPAVAATAANASTAPTSPSTTSTSSASTSATSGTTAPSSSTSSAMTTTTTGTTSKASPKLAAAAAPASTVASAAKALTPNKPLGELLRSIEPRFCFQPAVEELLLDMASDFVEDVVAFSSRLAKHRRSTELQAKDLQFCLAKNYGVSLAGAAASVGEAALNPLGADVNVRARPAKNSLHMHRMALKRKTLQRTAAKLKKAGALKPGDASGIVRKTIHRKNGTADAK